MSDENNSSLLERQYKIAIEARHTLNDNFHKWMTFYYVANGAILVAITTLYSKIQYEKGILCLSLIGIFVCMLWNLSCKGYYYWSKSYINTIIKLERKLINDNLDLGVYSTFSKKVAVEEDSSWNPTKPANISTPKLTLFFSLISICCWIAFSIWLYFHQFNSTATYVKVLFTILLFILLITIYLYILPRLAKSRIENVNTLI